MTTERLVVTEHGEFPREPDMEVVARVTAAMLAWGDPVAQDRHLLIAHILAMDVPMPLNDAKRLVDEIRNRLRAGSTGFDLCVALQTAMVKGHIK